MTISSIFFLVIREKEHKSDATNEHPDGVACDVAHGLVPAIGIRFFSPTLSIGKYTLKVRVSEMKPN